MGYAGIGIPIECGAGGFDANDNIARIPITNLIKARNITSEGDAWTKSPGASAFNGTPVAGSPNLVAGHDWNPDSTTQRIISVWADGKIYREVSGVVDTTLLKTLSTINTMGMFVTGGSEVAGNNRKLFYFSKLNPVQVLSGDGLTMADIATPPADWSGVNQPIGGGTHEGRLLGFGNANYSHGIYVSTSTNHEDFTSTGSQLWRVYPGDGQYIAAGISFLAYRWYVWKYPRGLYFVDTTNSLSAPAIIKVRDDVGAPGPGCVCRAGSDVIFLSSDGSLHSLVAAQESEDLIDSDLSAMFHIESWVKDQFAVTAMDRARIVYYAQKKQVWVALPGKSSLIPNRLLILDASSTPRMFYDDRGTSAPSGLFLRRDTDGIEKPTGGDAGKILLYDRVSRNFNGAAYTGEFELPSTDFGWFDPNLAGVDKAIDYIEAQVIPTGNHSLSFDIMIDGRLTQTVTMNLGSTGGVLGAFVLGTDRFGGRSVINHKVQVAGKGRYFGLRGYNSGLNQNFAVSKITIWLRPLGVGGVK